MKLVNSLCGVILVLMCAAAEVSVAAGRETSFTMTNAPLRDLLRSATKVLNKTYQANTDLCERFSIVTPADLSPMEAQITLESALLSHAYTLVPKGDVYFVKSTRSASYDAPALGCQSNFNDVVTRVFRLRNLSSAAAMKLLRTHMSKEVLMDEVPTHNTLILSDDAAYMERARSILKSHDPIADI